MPWGAVRRPILVLISSKPLLIVALAAAAAWMPTPPALVEQVYSTWAYAAWQGVLTGLSNRAPFALLDALVILVVSGWGALAARDISRTRNMQGKLFPAAARIAARTVVWAAVLYLLFLLIWGLNYRRTPL